MAESETRHYVVRVGYHQHAGARDTQEDSLGVSDFLNFKFISHGGVLGVLADGMGGYAEGKLASETAVRSFVETYSEKQPEEAVRDALMRALFAANDAIHNLPAASDPDRKVGTTLVAAVIHESKLHWISVGDSRAYLVRGESLIQLTTDHTYKTELNRQVQKNQLPAEEAENHPDRDVLTSYVGRDDLSDIDCNLKPMPLELHDLIILCSDGLYRALSPENMMDEISGHPQHIAEKLIDRALLKKKPGQDNLSAVVLYCDVPAEPAPKGPRGGPGDLVPVRSTNRAFALAMIIAAVCGLLWIFTQYRR